MGTRKKGGGGGLEEIEEQRAVGDLLCRLRKTADVTQIEAAAAIGIEGHTGIARRESGITKAKLHEFLALIRLYRRRAPPHRRQEIDQAVMEFFGVECRHPQEQRPAPPTQGTMPTPVEAHTLWSKDRQWADQVVRMALSIETLYADKKPAVIAALRRVAKDAATENDIVESPQESKKPKLA